MAVDFCYIISHGFAARMLLQTNLIANLLEKGHSVALISLDAKDENLTALAEKYPLLQLIEWKSKTTIWDDDYMHKRMYFLEDIDQNKALKEKLYNGLFFSDSKHPWKRLRPLFYYIIYRLVKLFPSIRSNFLKKEGKYLKSDEAVSILKQIKPKLLVSTYPVNIVEAKMLYEAQKSGVETILHLLSWDNITSKGKFPVLADRFIVWGDIMSDELIEHYGISKDLINICGVPHFDQHIQVKESKGEKKLISELGLDQNKPYLFFAMSSPRFAPREIDIVEWVSKAVESNMFGPDMQFIVRPHPQNIQAFTAKESWLHRLDKLISNRVAINYPVLSKSNIRWSMKSSDMIQLSELISGCSVCLNSGSTVSIDALMQNKPAVITSFDANSKITYWNSARRLIDYTHQKKFIEAGGAVVADSFKNLEETIKSFLSNPNFRIEERRNALLKECYKDDGKSTDRVIEVLINTLNRI